MMPNENKKMKIFLSAAEPSADMHCAKLIESIKAKKPDIAFVGVGGPKMAAAGCELIEVTADRASMIYNALAHVGRFVKLVYRIRDYLKKQKPDLVIVCDSPAFNFHVAKAAKKYTIKTIFYVAPQLWAWAPWRIKKLRRTCDKLCCILPFEEKWFSERQIDVTFVGNPLLDDIEDVPKNRKQYENFDPKYAKVAILPGSRKAEIDSLWKPMQRVAKQIKFRFPCSRFTAVAVDEKTKQILKNRQILGFKCDDFRSGSVIETVKDSDFTLVASGSATLQVAACGSPMAIMYKSSPLLWKLVGSWLIRTKFLSLVNILAQKELVPEFMPYFRSTEPIFKAVDALLRDRDKLMETSAELVRLTEPLKKNASQNTAEIAVEMLNKKAAESTEDTEKVKENEKSTAAVSEQKEAVSDKQDRDASAPGQAEDTPRPDSPKSEITEKAKTKKEKGKTNKTKKEKGK